MPTEAELADQLVSAHRHGAHDVDALAYQALDRDAAYRVQTSVMRALDAAPALLKTAVHSDGVGVVAPIFTLGSGSFQLPRANVVGLEVEVGVVLAHNVPNGADEAAVVAAIDYYFMGVEICGSRYADRSVAGPNGGLADSMSALGYLRSTAPRAAGANIDGAEITLEFAGAEIYRGVAKHGFGSVLASLLAYARSQRPEYLLTAGTVITTGSMCGLVPIDGTGHVVASLTGETLEFDIV